MPDALEQKIGIQSFDDSWMTCSLCRRDDRCLTNVNAACYDSRAMARRRHRNKHIEAAVRYAESVGWRVEISGGHAWGRLFCPEPSREGCIICVWSTPRSAENHARHIRREVDLCPHGDQDAVAYESEEDQDGS